MNKYEIKNFEIPVLKGISEKNIQEHLKLYAGYVNNANLVLEKINDLSSDLKENNYVIAELQRRFSFEFNGMRNHEYYFASLEGGARSLKDDSEFKKQFEKQYSDFDSFVNSFKNLAMTRGIGWAVLYWDNKTHQLTCAWVDEQHLGQLNGLQPVLMLDMWEHSYVADYMPSGKKQYVEDFFENLNWSVIEENFNKVQK